MIKNCRENHDVNHKQLPGLADLLDDHLRPDIDVSSEAFLRRLLKVFKDSETDSAFSDVLSRYGEDERSKLGAFVAGRSADEVGGEFNIGLSPDARAKLSGDNDGAQSERFLAEAPRLGMTSLEDFCIFDDEERKRSITIYKDLTFRNWGETVKNIPKYTCVPKTSHGVQEIVKYAKGNDMNVRASGYRHSWSPVFAKTGQILISTLDIMTATDLPNFESVSIMDKKLTQLNSIQFAEKPEKGKQRLVRVGCATTNEQLRRWCLEQKLDDQSSLPLNVIMVEITLGGSNGPVCHGAGRRHQTLSDLVQAIEYVDANGNLQIIDDSQPEFLSAASGCFGLLGIVTHITLKLDPMTYAVMAPRKLPMMVAIPPPPSLADEDIPRELYTKLTPEERRQAQEDFERHARDDFYSEWFWFPYTKKVWVNCWSTVEDSDGAVEYPSRPKVFLQFVQTIAIQILQQAEVLTSTTDFLPRIQTALISELALHEQPDIKDSQDAIKTQLPNALHFRRAIQNVRVRDVEIEIPLAATSNASSSTTTNASASIDWSLVQKAWWDAILTAYDEDFIDQCPQRMPLELRITGDSNVVMAPFRGNGLGTCSIEVLTLESVREIWHPFAQAVLDKWMNLKDSKGNYLKSRPHWAKEWYPFNVNRAAADNKIISMPMIDYVKNIYHDDIAEFKTILGKIGESQGWSLDEARARFSNDLWDEIIYNADKNGDEKADSAIGIGATAGSDKSDTPLKRRRTHGIRALLKRLEVALKRI